VVKRGHSYFLVCPIVRHESDQYEEERKQIRTLRAKVKKLKRRLARHEDKPGKTGKPKRAISPI
jgi:hypothetical protein